MLTKEYISKIKKQGNGAMQSLVNSIDDDKSMLFILNNLGRLPDEFDDGWIKKLLFNDNHKIRLNAVKNIGKVNNISNLKALSEIATNDQTTTIRREAVSSIGRMRNAQTIDTLLNLLDDDDPKIISQAIRGLLVFKGRRKIDKRLQKLMEHENETIKTVIKKEYFSSKKTSQDKLQHKESYDYLKNIVVLGDVRDILQEILNESFHLTFTSPPYYNARDYSIYKSYKAYLGFLEEVFKLTETFA